MRYASGGTGGLAGGKIKPRTGSPAPRVGSLRLATAIPAVVTFRNSRRELFIIRRSLAVLRASQSQARQRLGRPGLPKTGDQKPSRSRVLMKIARVPIPGLCQLRNGIPARIEGLAGAARASPQNRSSRTCHLPSSGYEIVTNP